MKPTLHPPVDGDLLPYLRAAVVNSCRNAVRRRLLIRRHAEKHAPCPPLTAEEAVMLSEDCRQVLPPSPAALRPGLPRAPRAATQRLTVRTLTASSAAFAPYRRISGGTGAYSGRDSPGPASYTKKQQ